MMRLPSECLLDIFVLLDRRCLERSQLVCRIYNDLITEELKDVCLRRVLEVVIRKERKSTGDIVHYGQIAFPDDSFDDTFCVEARHLDAQYGHALGQRLRHTVVRSFMVRCSVPEDFGHALIDALCDCRIKGSLRMYCMSGTSAIALTQRFTSVNKLVFDPPANEICADFLKLCTKKCVSELALWERDIEMTKLDANAVLSYLFSCHGSERRKLSLKGAWFPLDFFERLLQLHRDTVTVATFHVYASRVYTEHIRIPCELRRASADDIVFFQHKQTNEPVYIDLSHGIRLELAVADDFFRIQRGTEAN